MSSTWPPFACTDAAVLDRGRGAAAVLQQGRSHFEAKKAITREIERRRAAGGEVYRAVVRHDAAGVADAPTEQRDRAARCRDDRAFVDHRTGIADGSVANR